MESPIINDKYADKIAILNKSFKKFIHTFDIKDSRMLSENKKSFGMIDKDHVYISNPKSTLEVMVDETIGFEKTIIPYSLSARYYPAAESLDYISYRLDFTEIDNPIFDLFISKMIEIDVRDMIAHTVEFLKQKCNVINDSAIKSPFTYSLRFNEHYEMREISISCRVSFDDSVLGSMNTLVYDKDCNKSYGISTIEDFKILSEISVLCNIYDDFISIITGDNTKAVIETYKADKEGSIQLAAMVNL